MLSLDLTLPTAAENVALDEALLNSAEDDVSATEVLRLWCPPTPIVVLGRSSKHDLEVNLDFCKSQDIPVIRRCSGGATILTAENCLMYAVVLSYQANPTIRMLDVAHQFVMSKVQRAISQCGVSTDFQGTCDLTIGNRKVSGNALRCKRNWLVYHGTLICEGMDLELISKCLGAPKRQPEYRQGRSHADFLTHIPTQASDLKAALINVWQCEGSLERWPENETAALVKSKYTDDAWNFRI